MKIAIIGSGIAGMTCAWKLRHEADVTVFEANDYPGGHTHTVDVEAEGHTWPVDTGFIVFNEVTYPNFLALLDELGLVGRPSRMSFGVKCERTGLEYSGDSLDALFAQRRNLLSPRFWRMLGEIVRFNREAPRLLVEPGPGPDLGDYLRQEGYTEYFREHFILAMGAAIWSSPLAAVETFPAKFFVGFLHNHGMLRLTGRLQWLTLPGGSRTYMDLLAAYLGDRLRLRTPVVGLRRLADGVEVLPRTGPAEIFDEVVLACHSDQALRLLSDASELEREILGAMPYQANDVALHTDTGVLPKKRAAWSSWNYLVPEDAAAPVMATYHMNILQGFDCQTQFLVSLNCADRLDPDKVLHRFRYDHPLKTAEAVAAQARWQEISGHQHTHFCGAYWRHGFHEDGVVSALRVWETLRPQVRDGGLVHA